MIIIIKYVALETQPFRRNIVIVEFLHRHTHSLAQHQWFREECEGREEGRARAAWSEYFILYLIGFLGTVYNLTAVIHTGPANTVRTPCTDNAAGQRCL